MEALERANRSRLRRAEIGRAVRLAESRPDSRARAIEILRERERAVRTLGLADFLTWIRGVGEKTARRACARMGISETKPLDDLTERQVRLVEGWIRSRGR